MKPIYITLTEKESDETFQVAVSLIEGYGGNDDGTYVFIKGTQSAIFVSEPFSELEELDNKLKAE